MDVRQFADLRDRDLRREGLLVTEGRFLTERLLRARLPVLAVLCAPRFADSFRTLAAGVCPVEVLPETEIAAVAGYAFHRGVLAVARRPQAASLRGLLESQPERSLLAACPAIADAENLGSIIRSAAALGAGGVLLGPRCCDPWSRRALKVAMGATFVLPVALCAEEGPACEHLAAAGYTMACTSLARSATPLAGYRRPARLCLVLGNEAEGVGEPWRSSCDVELTIPMKRGTDSLNVAVAGAVFLHALQSPDWD